MVFERIKGLLSKTQKVPPCEAYMDAIVNELHKLGVGMRTYTGGAYEAKSDYSLDDKERHGSNFSKNPIILKIRHKDKEHSQCTATAWITFSGDSPLEWALKDRIWQEYWGDPYTERGSFNWYILDYKGKDADTVKKLVQREPENIAKNLFNAVANYALLQAEYAGTIADINNTQKEDAIKIREIEKKTALETRNKIEKVFEELKLRW